MFIMFHWVSHNDHTSDKFLITKEIIAVLMDRIRFCWLPHITFHRTHFQIRSLSLKDNHRSCPIVLICRMFTVKTEESGIIVLIKVRSRNFWKRFWRTFIKITQISVSIFLKCTKDIYNNHSIIRQLCNIRFKI